MDKEEKKEEFKNHRTEVIDVCLDVKEEKNVKNKIIKSTKYLNRYYDLRYNNINSEIEVRSKGETGYQRFDDLYYWQLLREVKVSGINISEVDFKSILYSKNGIVKPYNPFKDYLLNLPEWNGQKDYIKLFLDQVYLSEEDHREYLVSGFKKWFVSLVVSMFEDEPHPHFINQTAFILVGPQGRYKSTWLQSLLPKHMLLEYYYASNFNAHNKDHEKYLATKLIINMEEMESYNKTDVGLMKAKITQPQVVLRMPYARTDVHLKRRASFCGSTNNKQFLRDETGSRRWFVVEIDRIVCNPDYNIDTLYSQALQMYKDGFQYYFDIEDIKILEKKNEEFTFQTLEEELVLRNYKPPTAEQLKNPSVNNILFLTASDIAIQLTTDVEKLNMNNSLKNNIGKALAKHEFEQVRRRIDGKQCRLWAVKKVTEKSNESIEEAEDDNNQTI